MNQVFISYRREGGGGTAELIADSLKKIGYKVFFDKRSIKEGNFVKEIEKAIYESNDFVLILNQGALEFKEKDYFKMEIETALKYNKNIVPVFLTDFEPEQFSKLEEENKMPRSVLPIVEYNGISFADMANYDRRVLELHRNFLKSRPIDGLGEAQHDYVNENLEMLNKTYSVDTMNLIMKLNADFSNNERIQNLYKFVDNVSRLDDLNEMEEYVGDEPNDYVVYLTFFEVIYLTLVTNVLDIVVIDELFRFRFFAMVNNKTVQNRELLKMNRTYTNILKLYNSWSRYLIEQKENKGKHPSRYIEYFAYDLRRRVALYEFANNSNNDTVILLYDKNGDEKRVQVKVCKPKDKQAILSLQEEIYDLIPNEKKYIFVKTTEEELDENLEKGLCFAFYDTVDEGRMLTFAMFLDEPSKEHNLYLNLSSYIKENKNYFRKLNPDCLIFDTVFVKPEMRGYGAQSIMIELSQNIARKTKNQYILATVSPDNINSRSNFLKSGFKEIETKQMYDTSPRSFVLYDMKDFLK